MTLEHFESRCAAWGSDLARWPAAEREAAIALIATNPEARALLERAASLDGLLDEYTVAPLDQALVRRVMAATNVPVREARPRSVPFSRLAWWSSSAAGIGLVGAVVGSLAVTFTAGSALPVPAGGPLGGAWSVTAFSGPPSIDGIDE